MIVEISYIDYGHGCKITVKILPKNVNVKSCQIKETFPTFKAFYKAAVISRYCIFIKIEKCSLAVFNNLIELKLNLFFLYSISIIT